MGKIRVLDEHIANQIAAGEVVERPASVVKELVENAIDAESTTIDVAVEEGGIQLIRVTDNGTGIAADDCETAFLRHATSKIASGADLFRIKSLGFRGEALPSIAAVAKVECTSSARTDGLGKKIVIDGGVVKMCADAAHPRGTDIKVSDLFFNTPARLKYLHTVQTELSHISDFLYRIALAHPEIAFSFTHNGNKLLATNGNGDLLQVIAAIYGTDTARKMIRVEAETADFSLAGFVAKPEASRANRNGMTIAVNGRTVRHYLLTQAIMDSYHTLLPLHRFPIAVLHVRMEPSLLDVNVHPNKLEVRFSKEQELLGAIRQATAAALKRTTLIPSAVQNGPLKTYMQEQLVIESAPRQAGSGRPQQATASGRTVQEVQPELAPQQAKRPTNNRYAYPSEAASAAKPPQDRTAPTVQETAAFLQAAAPTQTSGGMPAIPHLHVIGQMRGTYILAQNEDGLYLIDQHAAHERINYERFYELFANPQEASQTLALPLTLEFSPTEMNVLLAKLAVFAQAGVFLEHFGGNTLLVRALPHWIPAGREKEIVEEMAEWVLAEKQEIDIGKLREKSAILCACKASIKANDALTVPEIEALIDRLRACRNPYTCPHGRPVVVSISNYELEKMFKRVM
ncbi:MAG TPA: DNA mismatch repair endonuclease MutL [Bacilli bacterium]